MAAALSFMAAVMITPLLVVLFSLTFLSPLTRSAITMPIPVLTVLSLSHSSSRSRVAYPDTRLSRYLCRYPLFMITVDSHSTPFQDHLGYGPWLWWLWLLLVKVRCLTMMVFRRQILQKCCNIRRRANKINSKRANRLRSTLSRWCCYNSNKSCINKHGRDARTAKTRAVRQWHFQCLNPRRREIEKKCKLCHCPGELVTPSKSFFYHP